MDVNGKKVSNKKHWSRSKDIRVTPRALNQCLFTKFPDHVSAIRVNGSFASNMRARGLISFIPIGGENCAYGVRIAMSHAYILHANSCSLFNSLRGFHKAKTDQGRVRCVDLHDKVKEFGSLDNLKMVLCNEGFSDVDIRYLGGMWVMFVFKSLEVKEKFLASVAINSWFSHLVQSFNDFVVDGRIMWAGSPFDFELTDEDGSESDESQSDDGLQEGVIGDEEDKQGEDDVSVVPDSMADKVNDNDGEDIEQNEAVDKNSTDPFGFTPREEGECDDSVFETNGYGEVNSSVRRKKTKLSGTESVGSGHFQQSDIPRIPVPLGPVVLTRGLSRVCFEEMSKIGSFLMSDKIIKEKVPSISQRQRTRQSITNRKRALQKELGKLDMIIDNGKATEENLLHRMETPSNSIQELDKLHNMRVAPKLANWQAVNDKLICGISPLPTTFIDLVSKCGGSMSRVNAWDDIVDKLVVRLSKWKMKTLSIGSSIVMESIKSRFNGVSLNSKESRFGLHGVRIILLGRRGYNKGHSWGSRGNLVSLAEIRGVLKSIWLNIVQSCTALKMQGFDTLIFMQKKIGNGKYTSYLGAK
ncbi:hypothetical protein Tco_0456023 [Tanacetum coccineum]